MRIDSLLKVVSPAEEGISQSTGNPYKRQNIVIEWQDLLDDGTYRMQHLRATLRGLMVDEFAKLNAVAGQTLLRLDLSFETVPYNGKVFTDITVKSIETL